MGRSAGKKAAECAQTRILSNPSAFLLGTMGPDPFYGGEIVPPVGDRFPRGLADRFHALEGRRLFRTLLPAAADDDATFAYALGFLSHFLLDHHTHPYIESRFPGKAHTPAEIALDGLLATRIGTPEETSALRRKEIACDSAKIDALIARVSWKLFALRTEGAYAGSLKKWLRIYHWQLDDKGYKRALTRPVPRIGSYLITPGLPDESDLLNEKHLAWGGATACAARTESFLELFDAASDEAAQWMDLACAERQRCDFEPLLRLAEGRSADAAECL